ncbi:MAG TPA: MerR family transcriptional regulator, partial [Clostridium sp.]|nr:MerR family transcriptional regulator [Clostridium sp.]
MLKIGDFSKLSRISIRMLRHYDEISLLVPKNTDSFTGYRYYGEDQLPVASRITALKDMGFGLSAI